MGGVGGGGEGVGGRVGRDDGKRMEGKYDEQRGMALPQYYSCLE